MMMMTVIVGNYPTLITSRAKSSAFTPPFADTCQTDRPADRVNTRPINSIRNVTAYPVQIFYPLASSELLLISMSFDPSIYTFHSPFPSFLHSAFSLPPFHEFFIRARVEVSSQTRTINHFSIERVCVYIHIGNPWWKGRFWFYKRDRAWNCGVEIRSCKQHLTAVQRFTMNIGGDNSDVTGSQRCENVRFRGGYGPNPRGPLSSYSASSNVESGNSIVRPDSSRPGRIEKTDMSDSSRPCSTSPGRNKARA